MVSNHAGNWIDRRTIEATSVVVLDFCGHYLFTYLLYNVYRAEGELSKGLEVARNLLAMGISWSQIMQATGLTEEQLKQLQS